MAAGWRAIVLLCALALVAAACGDLDEADEGTQAAVDAAEDVTDEEADEGTEGDGGAADDRAGGDDVTLADDGADLPLLSGGAAAAVDVEPADPGAWTYLLYSMADTDLEEALLIDVLEAASVGSDGALNIVALIDRSEGEAEGDLLDIPDWSGAKLFHVLPDELVELADLGDLDLGDPAELAGLIEFGTRAFPADRYALTISDHGGGWTGMGPDDSSGEVMDLAEIVNGLDSGLANAGLAQIDLLGFDACLMATYEVASAVAPYADHLLASAELEPGHGWDYTVLSAVQADPAIDPASLGTAFVDAFAAQADEYGTGADITLSLVDLAQMPALDEAMAAFAGELEGQVEALAPVIGRQRAAGIEYARSPNPAQDPQLTDLGVFVAEIGVQSLQVADAADAVLRAIGDAVVHQTVGPARLGSTGLSIYFPTTPDLADPAYAGVGGAPSWLAFLDAYHGAGQAIPAEVQPALAEDAAPDEGSIATGDALVTEVEGGVEVSVQLDPATVDSIASASLSFGYVDPETDAIVQLGDTEAEVLDDGTVVGFSDLTVLTITDAVGDTIEAYLSLEFDEEAGLAHASVPLEYLDPATEESSPVDLSIVLDGETGDVLQEVYYLLDEGSGSYGELSADPEALVAPLVLVYGADGSVEWTRYGDVALYADLPALQYDLAPLEPGTEIYVDLVVTDFGGNELIAAATFTQG